MKYIGFFLIHDAHVQNSTSSSLGEYQTSDGMEVAIQTLYVLDHFKQRE